MTARLKVVSIVFGAAYMALFLYSERTQYALVRYYPVLRGFYREPQPPQTAGPSILWYSWLLGALVVSLVAALLVPRSWAERLPHGIVWLVPALLLLGIVVYERRWFY